MTSVDLRSNYEAVYNQGSDGSCGPHATTAVLDVMYERATGKPHRFDKQHIWNWCKFFQGLVGNVGITFDGLRQTLAHQGVKLDDQIIKGFALKRTEFPNDWESVKHLLKMGVPQILIIRAGSSFDSRNNGKPWRTHRWGDIHSIVDFQFTHAVALVGFDDATQCWLIENSWGAEWGDGGFFGIPYDQMRYMHEELWHINELPIPHVPTEGYKVPATLSTKEQAAFTERAKPQLLKLLMDAFSQGGAQGLIDTAVSWGVSDKHIETLAGWDAGTIRGFKSENPGLKWDGFVWDQL